MQDPSKMILAQQSSKRKSARDRRKRKHLHCRLHLTGFVNPFVNSTCLAKAFGTTFLLGEMDALRSRVSNSVVSVTCQPIVILYFCFLKEDIVIIG